MSGFGATSPKKRIHLEHMPLALALSGPDCTEAIELQLHRSGNHELTYAL